MRGGGFLRAVATVTVSLVLVLGPSATGAQEVTHRSPNLSGGWTGVPGTLEFHFDHRFWLLGERVFNSPTFLVAVPVTDGGLLGGRYASNSRVTEGSSNEWEVFGRWAAGGGDWPVELGVTGGYNVHAGSVDGELAVAVPLSRVRFLGAARGFSDAGGMGETGWFAGGGIVVPLRNGLSLAGDLGRLWRDETTGRRVWGIGLQLQIPTTPHSVAIRAANTRTGTLQGTSMGNRTTWGFEFTIPFTIRRYFGGTPGSPDEPRPARDPTAEEADPPGEVEVTMTEDLRFDPETVRIQVGETVVWRNTSNLPHTVTADPDAVRDPQQVALPEGAAPFDSGFMFTGDVFRHTFTVPGEYVYICIPHDQVPMLGRIVVEE